MRWFCQLGFLSGQHRESQDWRMYECCRIAKLQHTCIRTSHRLRQKCGRDLYWLLYISIGPQATAPRLYNLRLRPTIILKNTVLDYTGSCILNIPSSSNFVKANCSDLYPLCRYCPYSIGKLPRTNEKRFSASDTSIPYGKVLKV